MNNRLGVSYLGIYYSHVLIQKSAQRRDDSSGSFTMDSPETTDKILTTPAPGITIKPIYEYTKEQKNQIVDLRQASLPLPMHLPFFFIYAPL